MAEASRDNNLTNGAVLDWYRLENVKEFTVVTMREMFMEKFQLETCVSASQLNSKVKDLIKKEKSVKYKKGHNATQRYVSLLADEFKAVSEEPRSSTTERIEATEAREEKKAMKRKIVSLEREVDSKSLKSLENEALLEVAIDKNEQMKNEISDLKEELVICEA